MTSARSLKTKFISLDPLARLPSGRCLFVLFLSLSVQHSTIKVLSFCNPLQIRWLLACGYNEYLEESRELKVIPPRYAFPLLTTS